MMHPGVQHLIRHDLGWRRLRPVQVAAAGPVHSAGRDVLVIAGTASGKTEAAWLPVFSRLLTDGTAGLGVLCVSPLKALIDDQTRRLAWYGRHLDLRVEGWHGDISAARKAKALQTPPAALIITPESLQGLLLRKPTELTQVLAPLRYVIVDEIHAFAGTDRGQQLQSLLHAIEVRLARRVPRIALSATVSEPDRVTEFLRPGAGGDAHVVRVAGGAGPDIDVHLFDFHRRPAAVDPTPMDGGEALNARDVAGRERLDIARRIDESTRGRRALVFAGSRFRVEEMTALLRDEAVTGTRRRERFHAHHGSLSPEVRRSAESALHDFGDTTVVCTSTLELGVDLPDLDQVVQVDTCLSVAALRQRLGRSGRREGTRPTLRMYMSEAPLPADGFADQLRVNLVQSLATVELIVGEDWVEPADLAPLGLSTLVHQTLAMLADPAGTTAARAWKLLCGSGPWRRVAAADYAALLRTLATHGLVRQDARGLLFLDEVGQQVVGRRDFPAVFAASAEITVRHNGKRLGTLPARYPIRIGSPLAFGGRTWRVVAMPETGWTVDVVPHAHGLPPKFQGAAGGLHRRVRETMRAVYESGGTPEYLDDTATALLAEGRAAYAGLDLARESIVQIGDDSLLALWTGDRELATIVQWLQRLHPGLKIDTAEVGLVVRASADAVGAMVDELLTAEPPRAEDLARDVVNKATAKYDRYLPDALLTADYASRSFDIASARSALKATERRSAPRT